MRSRAEHRPIPEHWDENAKNRRRLINEFRDRLNEFEYAPPEQTEGVVALSAPPEFQENGEILEKTSENIARVKYSIDIIKQIASNKSGISIEELTASDIIENGPPLILNGETEQLPAMVEIAQEENFPLEHTQQLNCGDRGIGNTKTQFEKMNIDDRYKNTKHLTFVTNSYHVPRVARTADKNLDTNNEFEVIGIPHEEFEYNIFRKTKGEIKRILAYSEKNDITKFFTEPATPIIEFGANINNTEISHTDETTPLSPEAQELLEKLKEAIDDKSELQPFNGQLANVDTFNIKDGNLKLRTSNTDYYSYLSSSFAHREDHAENPIRPLAVSATLISPDGKIVTEERTGVTELEGKFAVFGGSLKPGEKPEEAIADRLKNKLGLDIKPENIILTGADQENLQNIVEIFYMIKLEEGQLDKLKTSKDNQDKKFTEFSINQDLKDIENHFHQKDITDWNPSSFYNIMYTLIKSGHRTPEEIKNIIEPLRKKIARKPFRYKYPIEKILDK
ncbi:MAG: hypothetical protein ACNFW9_01755 [Candidatus Kerfeldbacteria bacterium]